MARARIFDAPDHDVHAMPCAMDQPVVPSSPQHPGLEPALIERARRIGWVLLAMSLAALAAARMGAPGGERLWQGVAIGTGMLGLLAIVNVALVRGLYAQVRVRDQPEPGVTSPPYPLAPEPHPQRAGPPPPG